MVDHSPDTLYDEVSSSDDAPLPQIRFVFVYETGQYTQLVLPGFEDLISPQKTNLNPKQP